MKYKEQEENVRGDKWLEMWEEICKNHQGINIPSPAEN